MADPVEDAMRLSQNLQSPSYIKEPDPNRRELTDLGLYSPAAEALRGVKQEKGTPAQFKAMLLKGGVKPDEIKQAKFDETFGSRPSVTRQELRKHFHQNLPKLGTHEFSDDTYDYDPDEGGSGGPKYADYTIPGGKNYREQVLHLPSPKMVKRYHVPQQGPYVPLVDRHTGQEVLHGMYGRMRDEAQRRNAAESNTEAPYRSSHWDDVNNPILHLRMSDRTHRDPGAMKLGKDLHLEELQSDWAQEGRKHGFGGPKIVEDDGGFYAETPSGRRSISFTTPELAQEFARTWGPTTPHGPYVDNTSKWVDLGLKHALMEAAKGGHKNLLITPGEEQAKRYSLAKRLEALDVRDRPGDKAYDIAMKEHGGDWHSPHLVFHDKLEDAVGKEMAQKIREHHGQHTNTGHGPFQREYSGLDLNVGGEGMKGFYDKIVPAALEKLAKKHDPEAKVHLFGHDLGTQKRYVVHDVEDNQPVSNPFETHAEALKWAERNAANWKRKRDDLYRIKSHVVSGPKVHKLEITPKMRESILKGLPAYSEGGEVYADGGAVDEPGAYGEGGVAKLTREEQRHMHVLSHVHPSTWTPDMHARAHQLISKGAKYASGGEIPPGDEIGHEVDQTGMPQSTDLGGLKFPDADAANRMRLRQMRVAKNKVVGNPGNPRTIIKAPPGSNHLPDFATGDINFEDWKQRHERILSPDEIHKAARWYKDVAHQFNQYYPDNPDLARRHRNAWLVAQQNISPGGAMHNVLMQQEQINRGMPKRLWKAGGMPNPTEAARAVLQDQPITAGVGQKIGDFVDAAEGKRVRSWMGNHPEGGDPFVVDVHTARDTGMVDKELLNHLERLGYDKRALKKLKVDMQGTPTATAYENRADWGRALTKHLNEVGWMGRKDWTPAEAQAVGWMGMTKLTRNAEEDSESGLERNLRRLSFEVAPGEGSPWAKKYGQHFAALSPEDKVGLTRHLTERAMEHARNLAGIPLQKLVHGTGAWQRDQNPAAVGQTLATHKGADIAANALGYLLNQTEVWHHRAKPVTANPKGFAVDFIEHGSKHLEDPQKLQDLWEKVMAADPSGLIQGYQPITTAAGERGIRALVDKGGVKTHQSLQSAIAEGGPLHRVAQQLPYDIRLLGHEAEITKARNDWSKDPHGKGYLDRLEQALGRNPRAHLDRARAQLEKDLEAWLAKAKPAQGRARGGRNLTARPPTASDFGPRVARQDGGRVVAPYPEPAKTGKSALQIALEIAAGATR